MLNWASELLNTSKKTRIKIASQVLHDIARFNSKTGQATPKGIELAKSLLDKSKYELIGFIPFLCYMKVDGTQDEINPLYFHPFGHFTLLLYKKDTCQFVIAAPGLRLNKSYLDDVPDNGVVIGNVEGVIS